MAVVKHICGSCGAEINAGAVQCPKCAATLEWGEVNADKSAKCQVCGFQNSSGNTVCQSCGARLANVESRGAGTAPPSDRNKTKRAAKAGVTQASRRSRFEPWQIVSVIAVLGLVGYLLYLELSRPHAASPGEMSAVPGEAQPQMPAMKNIAPFEQAAAANPSNPEALLQLANVLHDNGMYPRAIATYQKYLALKPNDPNARVDLGICYYELSGQDTAQASILLATAIREMETALKGSPRHQPAAFNLGVVNLAMGNLGQSRTWFRKAVDLDKNSELGARAQKMLDQHAFTP